MNLHLFRQPWKSQKMNRVGSERQKTWCERRWSGEVKRCRKCLKGRAFPFVRCVDTVIRPQPRTAVVQRQLIDRLVFIPAKERELANYTTECVQGIDFFKSLDWTLKYRSGLDSKFVLFNTIKKISKPWTSMNFSLLKFWNQDNTGTVSSPGR